MAKPSLRDKLKLPKRAASPVISIQPGFNVFFIWISTPKKAVMVRYGTKSYTASQTHQLGKDADIKRFFNDVNHEWMMKFLEMCIGDPNILRLIQRMLKADVEGEGDMEPTEEGTLKGPLSHRYWQTYT